MRTYEKDQDNSVVFEGQKAEKLISLRQAMDAQGADICSELHKAIEIAQEEWKRLYAQYKPQFEQVMVGTELERVPFENVGLDYSKAAKTGIVFGKKLNVDPIALIFQKLVDLTDSQGPLSYPGSDSIIFETRPGFEIKWGTDQSKQKEYENA